MKADIVESLAQAMRERTLVRFRSRFEPARIMGYVLDIGPRFFLVAVVNDRLWLDGFECFRLGDVRGLEPNPKQAFVEAALEKRGEVLGAPPPIELSGIERLLLSANDAFPLVTIHRERVDPDACWIGRLVEIERGHAVLLEISPDAVWDDEPCRHRLSEITHVGFGADYEDALHLVGGDPADRPFRSPRFRLH
jgi:hypothetical protein